MSDREHEVRELLAPFRSVGLRAVGPDERAPSRERMLASLRELVVTLPETRRRARARRRLAAFMVASAAAVLLFAAVRTRAPARAEAAPDIVALTVMEGTVTQKTGAQLRTLSPGAVEWMGPEAQLETASKSRMRVETRSGLRVTVGSATRLLMDLRAMTRNPWVQLLDGSVSCEVPKLGEGTHFAVHTPDANVIVHGTVFSVEIRGNRTARHTCARVEEGVVTVIRSDHEDRLTKGESSGCEDPVAAAALDGSPATDVPAGTKREAGRAGRPSTPRAAPSDGVVEPYGPRHDEAPSAASHDSRREGPATPLEPVAPIESTSAPHSPEPLAEQNRLLGRALAAESHGDNELAVKSLRLMLKRYPNSPLAPEAAAALARIAGNHRDDEAP